MGTSNLAALPFLEECIGIDHIISDETNVFQITLTQTWDGSTSGVLDWTLSGGTTIDAFSQTDPDKILIETAGAPLLPNITTLTIPPGSTFLLGPSNLPVCAGVYLIEGD